MNMTDANEQSEQIHLFIKLVDVINYVTSVSKKKPQAAAYKNIYLKMQLTLKIVYWRFY